MQYASIIHSEMFYVDTIFHIFSLKLSLMQIFLKDETINTPILEHIIILCVTLSCITVPVISKCLAVMYIYKKMLML